MFSDIINSERYQKSIFMKKHETCNEFFSNYITGSGVSNHMIFYIFFAYIEKFKVIKLYLEQLETKGQRGNT